MSTILEHTVLRFGLSEIPALLALLAAIIVFMVKNYKAKKELKELEEQITLRYLDEATADVDEYFKH